MLRTTILIQSFIDGSFNYPSTPKSTRFLYYLSVYGNLSKNSFFSASVSKAGAKVRLFPIPSKLFGNYFIFFKKKEISLDENQERFLLNLIIYKADYCDLLIFLRSLSYQVHKLIEFRRDDNLCAAIALLAHFGVVALQRVVLTTSTGSEALRVYAVLVL